MTTVRGDASGGADLKIGGGFFTDGTGIEHYGVQSRAYNGTEVNTGGTFWGELTDASSFPVNVGVEGVTSVASGAAVEHNIAVRASCGIAGDTDHNYGVHSVMWNYGANVKKNHGGYFDAWTNSSSANNYGVWTTASGGTNPWALWVQGNAWITGNGFVNNGILITSDENLKTNISDITDALSKVTQLQPKSYDFRTSDYPTMELSSEPQIGLLAQQVQQVVPEAVKSTVYPAQFDSLGNQTSAAFPVLGVDYIKLIPLLIGAIQEQQAQISTLQQDLASCCAAHGDADQRSMSSGAGAGAGASEALRTDLHIIPNPVADLTQLRYTVAAPGRTRLEVSDASGKRLEVLEEAVREVGSYSHAWNTTDLAPGIYHCTLFLNDSFVVKKAVKVAR
ncbi:MAG: tail fiber domain-containing protein [Flavobacteriales bacterium]|nr:tail fiber domain-containing protein [Flavobacteriales bacterium]